MGVGVGDVLRDRDAGLYLSGVVVSGFGTSAMWLVAGIWTKSLTGSDSLAALTVFAMWAPTLVGPLLGTVADRMRRRPLLIGCNLAMAVLLPLLLAVDSADRIWLLYSVLVVYGAAGVVQDAAETALVATAVDKRLLSDFNGLRMTANEGMKLLAPLAGAGLYARFGGAPVALLDAVTFALAAGCFALMRVREEPPAPRRAEGRLSGTAEGFRRLRATPAVRPLVFGAAVTMLLAGINGAAIYAVVDRTLGHSPTYAGVLYAVQGAGSVAIGLLAGPLMRRLPERVFAAAGVALFALSVAARALPYDAVALASAAGVGLGLPCVLIAALTAVQREIPDRVLGRTAASANTLIYVPNAVALALGAGLIAFVDLAVLLPVTGVAGLLTALALARSGPAPRLAPPARPGSAEL
ncbi:MULTISPECIES: MFS transporter [unclassified Streptomyces]|uniref:MFS transporter n=1 Tax=unclassified Streptomyces TaxID=2593676 RepID=UPI00081EEE12|nr:MULTISPECIES: MFS transporter [unclassified Streptomyces]SCG05080.1 Na+/melibiose symporter [Streptomyces sp. MnatMP-M17]